MTATYPRPTPFRALWLALLALAVAACGGGAPAPTPGEPLATLGGQLRAADAGAAQGPLRLALAWYPGLLAEDGRSPSQPGAIETQEVAYTGTLPLAYTFDVRSAPPASALVAMPEGYAGRGAVGILLAYQDGNGNGTLDTIPADGSPIDHVVGASLEWTTAPAFLVAYLTHDQAPSTGLKAGFNLLRIADAETTEVVPLSTPIPVSVSEGGPRLDLFVCEAAWDGSSTQAPCGLELDGEELLQADIDGEIYVSPDAAEASFRFEEQVDGQPAFITDATVTLGGVAVPLDAESGWYHAAALEPSLFAEEGTVELVVTRGDAVLRREVAIPAFELTDVPATVESGTAFDVAWSVPASADSFDLYLSAGGSFLVNAWGLADSPYHVTPVEHVGEARLTVAALALGEIAVTVVRTTTLEFVGTPGEPVEQALQVGGVVSLWEGGAETRLFVHAADTVVGDATVTLGGVRLPFDWSTGFYALDEVLGSAYDQGPVALRVERNGQVVERVLQAPALPTLVGLADGAQLDGDVPVTVSWEAAAHADRYDLLVELEGAEYPVSVQSTSALSATFGPAGQGSGHLYLSAVKSVGGGSENAVIELMATRVVGLSFVR